MTSDPTINFTGRDFTTEYERMLTLLTTELPEYTDLNHSDPGITFVRLSVRSSDQNNYYIDRAAQEAFLLTATFKQSVIDIGRASDYLPTLASPASTRVLLTKIEGVEGSIPIPQYTEMSRLDEVAYVTTEAITIYSNESSKSVDVLQATATEVVLTSEDFELDDWDNRPRYNLGYGVISNICEVSYSDEPVVEWTQVTSFWQSETTDNHYLLELNGDDDTVWLVLGNGIKGASIAPGYNLTVKYFSTVGPDGNCGTGKVSYVPDDLTLKITCTNTEIATGGAYAESIESIREMIPACAKIQNRGVAIEDYPALIETLPGILHVQASDRTLNTEWPHLYVVLYAVPDGGGPMSSYLRELVLTKCGDYGTFGGWPNRYILYDAIEVPTDVTVRIGILSGYNSVAVIEAVTEVITNLFEPSLLGINYNLPFSTLSSAVEGVTGVSYAEFSTPTGTMVCDVGEILTVGTITVTIGT